MRLGHAALAVLAVVLVQTSCAKQDRLEARSAQREKPASVAPVHSPEPLLPGNRHPAFAERVEERGRLVALAIEGEGRVKDPRVLQAMRIVPRHRFVPEASRASAYLDRPLPIGHGQTISQPYIVAAMTEAVLPQPHERCLEIGTGSGYQAAVLAELCQEVYSIEYLPAVAAFGENNLRALGYGPDRVRLRVGDGFKGWPEAAPFAVIVVTAAPEQVPPPLLQQLAVSGRLVIPVGRKSAAQELEKWLRLRAGNDPQAFQRETLMGVRFVPFLGDETR